VEPELHRPAISYFAVLFHLGDDDHELVGELARDALLQRFPIAIGSRHRLLFEDLVTRFGHAQSARQRAAAHHVQAFLWDLIASERDPDDHVSAPSAGEDEFNVHIERAITLFEKHLDGGGLTIGAVAERVGVTQAHLTRLFTEQFGMPPLQYWRRLRMETAASLLLNTTKSIKEIAWEMGYANQFHFSRSFSRVAEISPQRFRERYFRTAPTAYAGKVMGAS
jgi:AraC-like DNA-binding protein